MTGPAGDSPLVVLRSPDGASAAVHLDGAHVTSWRPAPDGEERLFVSARSAFREGAAIRGGIPVIFPQFAAEGALPRHGFARTMRWTQQGEPVVTDGQAKATFVLAATAATRAIWPGPFSASLAVAVGGDHLHVGLTVRNEGEAPFSFAAALHTYLRMEDVERSLLQGLRGHRFRESAVPGVLRTDTDDALRPVGEVDRVYVGVTDPLVLREPRRAVEISSHGFPDVVVWNPGATKAAALADMEPGGERRMLCVEAAAVQERIVLQAGRQWTGIQRLRALPDPR